MLKGGSIRKVDNHCFRMSLSPYNCLFQNIIGNSHSFLFQIKYVKFPIFPGKRKRLLNLLHAVCLPGNYGSDSVCLC